MNALDELHLVVADKLCELEDLFADWNVPMHKLTLVARDPAKPESYIVVTNDKDTDAVVTLLNGEKENT